MSVDGNWRLIIDGPTGAQDVDVSLRSNDGTLAGHVVNAQNGLKSEIFDGVVDGNAVSWKVKLRRLMLTLSFAATIDDDVMSGQVKAGRMGPFPVTGQRR